MRTRYLTKGTFTWVCLMCSLLACNAQEDNKEQTRMDQPSDTTLLGVEPKVDIRVNKEYDENGELIRYDSTYSSIYHSHQSDPLFMDSIIHRFRPWMGDRYPFLDDPGFNDLFFRDTLLYPDFFRDNFFQGRLEQNRRYMERMMAEMDSLKNLYFERDGP